MSVATSISLEQCHRPCPDMRHHSLTQEDKARGLSFIERTRSQLRQSQLTPLQEEYSTLTEQEKKCHDFFELKRINARLRQLDKQMEQISTRWS
ncbi:hypothetical protein [Vibrio amylolyticus]|uniref:hypothetical protein n=1 Tax=Vibrio amylolyticus TaxID=2847292 RepID=UPI0035502157